VTVTRDITDRKRRALLTTADAALVAAVETPYASVDDALERLRRLESLLAARGDRRAVFLTVYSRMTERIRDRIDRGGFSDPAWLRDYTTTFADDYRRAFLAFERGEESVPDPWRLAFGTARRGDALVVEDAFLGINAHINYDLALTLRDVGIDPDRGRKRADHRAVGEVLSGLVDAQQAALADVYAPGIDDIDAAFAGIDERLSLFALTEGRKQAWRVAVVLSDIECSPVRSLVRWSLQTTATGGARLIRQSALPRDRRARLRQLEREGVDTDAVLAALRTRLDDA